VPLYTCHTSHASQPAFFPHNNIRGLIMLLTSERRANEYDDTGTVHNYYEHMVLEEIRQKLPDRRHEADLLADIACVALNHLPPRYIRHDVDMAFYLSPRDRIEMEEKVANAVQQAMIFVEQRGNRAETGEA